jgi:hypothetical protein
MLCFLSRRTAQPKWLLLVLFLLVLVSSSIILRDHGATLSSNAGRSSTNCVTFSEGCDCADATSDEGMELRKRIKQLEKQRNDVLKDGTRRLTDLDLLSRQKLIGILADVTGLVEELTGKTEDWFDM